MSRQRAGKIQEDARDLSCRGLSFFPLDGTLCLLGQGNNITKTSSLLIPILSSQAPPYNKALNWLQFAYTGDWMGAYVYPASTKFNFITISEGEPLFSPALRRLQNLYTGAYARGYTSTIGPLDPDYELEH